MTTKEPADNVRLRQLANFGAGVRAERSKRGYSQESFAEHVEIDRSYMGGVERGQRNLSFKNLMKILEGLDMEPSEFFAKHVSLHPSKPRRPAKA
mgnify:CR=1 FL=1